MTYRDIDNTPEKLTDDSDFRFELFIASFDDRESSTKPWVPQDWNKVNPSKFLRIRVRAKNLPEGTEVLKGKYRLLTDSGTGKPEDDIEMKDGTSSDGFDFFFIIDHYELTNFRAYLVRISDDFDDPKVLSSHKIKTQ